MVVVVLLSTKTVNPSVVFHDEENKTWASSFKFLRQQDYDINSGQVSSFSVHRAERRGPNRGEKFGKHAQVWVDVLKLQLFMVRTDPTRPSRVTKPSQQSLFTPVPTQRFVCFSHSINKQVHMEKSAKPVCSWTCCNHYIVL